MVFDKCDTDFEYGTGRQFLIKWCNLPYSEATYEFERDFILNDIDYKDHAKAFLKRVDKPSKRQKVALMKKGEDELRRLYKVFGDKSNLDDESRGEV